ncbi:uncharacterized protein LOC101235260 isoform X1 [Hydra vulgaris]|uniref:uncharacterized protein LOC101235260 isoform X1 n=1 Tax=Hydra vulgaris TaxID=6087 RepID=UPI001F5EB728|nr:uncharacterized protein LOC101235260 [Hydra vulgaris]
MTSLAAGLLESCEKVICDQLKFLNEYEKLCEDALKTIRKLHDASKVVWSSQSPNILLLKQILSEIIKGSESVSLTTDSLAQGSKSLDKCTESSQEIPINGKKLSDLENKTLNKDTESPQEISINAKKLLDLENNILNKVTGCPQEVSINDLSDLEKFSHQMQCISGPKIGVRYQIEVTSPLGLDGSYWVRNKENEFLQNKLQPLSEFLRKTTMEDKSLWKVQDDSKVLCVKSSETQLWMRVLVERRNSQNEVRVRYIDYGTTEDCQENRLCTVPEVLARIPYMAFHCTFFEKAVNLGYDAKWKFSDLTNKQILNFTCEKRVLRNNKVFFLGKLETASFENVPSVNISSLMTDFYADNEELVAIKNPAIHSRDIRTQDPNSNITVVTEFIKKKDENICGNTVTQDVTQNLLVNSDSKNKKNISPIVIHNADLTTEVSCKKVNWGDCDTPCADDFEVAFEPLDEKVFEDVTKITSPQTIEVELNIINNDLAKKNDSINLIITNECQTMVSPNLNKCQTLVSPNLNECQTMVSPDLNECQTLVSPNLNECQNMIIPNLNEPSIPTTENQKSADSNTLNSTSVIPHHSQTESTQNLNVESYQVTIDLPENISKDIKKTNFSNNEETKTDNKNNESRNSEPMKFNKEVFTSSFDGNSLTQSSLKSEIVQPQLINPVDNHFKKKIVQAQPIFRPFEYSLIPRDNFDIINFHEYLAESQSVWVARELCNLTHRYLENISSKFFLKVCPPFKNEMYDELKLIYEDKCLYLKDHEADAIKYNQTRNIPIFVVLKKKFNQETERDSVSLGICQVLGPVLPVYGKKYRFKCSSQFISTATIEWKWCFVQKTCEIEKQSMRNYLKTLIKNLQCGKCCDTFKELTQLQNKVGKPSTDINKAQAEITDRDEDWDLDINPHVISQSQNFGSDDECERDINADYETFGVTQKDLNLLNPI